MKSNSVILFEITTDTNMTESELCPPDPCVTDPIKKPDEFLYLLRKKYSIDVRGDRIPILSSLKISANINMTESELCPPDPCVTDLIKKSKLSRTGFSSNKLNN